MKNNASVTTDVISRMCKVLECDISDIIEYVEDISESNTYMEENDE
jgi:DNA-binding Xre family transcriptional regulator